MEKNKIRKYKLMLTAIVITLLLLSTATALKIEQPNECKEPEDKQQKQEQVKKNGIVICCTGVFLPPADTVPVKTSIEINSIDGTVHRKIPAFMGFLNYKIIFRLNVDKEYEITAVWKDQTITERVTEFNRFGIARIALIFQEEGP